MLHTATLSANNANIQVHLPARSKLHERLATIEGAKFNRQTLRWYVPLEQFGRLLEMFGNELRYDKSIFTALTKDQIEAIQESRKVQV